VAIFCEQTALQRNSPDICNGKETRDYV